MGKLDIAVNNFFWVRTNSFKSKMGERTQVYMDVPSPFSLPGPMSPQGDGFAQKIR